MMKDSSRSRSRTPSKQSEKKVKCEAPTWRLLRYDHYAIVDGPIAKKLAAAYSLWKPRLAGTCRRGPQAKMIHNADLHDETPNTSNWALWSKYRVTGLGDRVAPMGLAPGLAHFAIKYEDDLDESESEIEQKSFKSWNSVTVLHGGFHEHDA